MRRQAEKGIALIIVISILAIVSIMAISFTFTMRLEAKTAINYQISTQAKYLAEAGLAHAREVLRMDGDISRTDHDGEFWRSLFKGTDVDNDSNGTPDSAWINFTDASGEVIGRYAVLIIDELGKINLNSAGWFPDDPFVKQDGITPFEVSLEDFFEAEGVTDPLGLARNIVATRYGGESGLLHNQAGVDDDRDGLVDEDGFPGRDSGDKVDLNDEDQNNVVLSFDGLDNNADGVPDEPGEGINEPGEFHRTKPFADDRPFLAPTEVQLVKGMEAVYGNLASKLSVLSMNKDTDIDGVRRLSINTALVNEIYSELVEREVAQAGRFAVNLIDYRDSDQARTTLVVENTATPDPFDTITYHGVESIRINEIMIKPILNVVTSNEGVKNDWTWYAGDHYRNAMPGRGVLGEGVWEWPDMLPGFYYATFFAKVEGQDVGDVWINGLPVADVKHGDTIGTTVEVKDDGLLTVKLQNNKEDGSTYFKSVEMSQQPDGEYVEVINLSDREVSLSGWTLEYAPLLDEGWRATVGEATIAPRGHLILAVDADDTDTEPFTVNPNDPIKANSISVRGIWPNLTADDVVELEIEEGTTIEPRTDLIIDMPDTRQPIILLDAVGRVVQEIEYDPLMVSDYVSVEKGDPAYALDQDGNGMDDFWYLSLGELGTVLGLATPGDENRNDGMLGHSISERSVKDRHFGSAGEVARVSAGAEWSRVSSTDMARMADRMTPFALRLEAEGHLEESTGWAEVLRSAPLTSWYESNSSGEEVTFSWSGTDRIEDGAYIMRVWGENGEAIAISIYQKGESGGLEWAAYTPTLVFQGGGAVTFGAVVVGADAVGSTPSESLKIRCRNDSISDTAHVDYVTLEPVQTRPGSININTASREVLAALPGLDLVLAQALVDDRLAKGPFGERDHSSEGITLTLGTGDLLLSDALVADLGGGATPQEIEATRIERFRLLSNYIDIKSDLFEAIVTAQALRKDEVVAESKIRVIVER